MTTNYSARAIRLPCLELTEVIDSQAANATKVKINSGSEEVIYFTATCYDETEARRRDGKPTWMGTKFNLFPVVVGADGVPWSEAVLYLLKRLEETVDPNMDSFKCIADDLADYKRFFDGYCVDWTVFPENKLRRPTYRYRANLTTNIQRGVLAASLGKRRIGTVISFYRWAVEELVINPEYSPWSETDKYISYSNSKGLRFSKKVTVTDLQIKNPKCNDPYSEYIEDDGQLRPLSEEEQAGVLKALGDYGNTELTLIHLVALFTGARMQTVLTFRVSTINRLTPRDGALDVRIPVGPGTLVDTKGNKRHVLHMPIWLFERLRVYANSDRALRRQSLIQQATKDSEKYLFLTVKGRPFYSGKSDLLGFDDGFNTRHIKSGQAVRQLVGEFVIPRCCILMKTNFSYRFHDLRASYGMNLTRQQLKRVQSGEISLHEAREYVRSRMGHSSSKTTDLYLKYSGRIKFYRSVNDAYANHLRDLALDAIG